MGVAVDLAADQLLGAGHGQRGHLPAQVLAGAGRRRLDLGERGRLLAVGLLDRLFLGQVDDLRAARLGLVDDLRRLAARFAQDLVDLLLGLRQVLLAAVGSGNPDSVIDIIMMIADPSASNTEFGLPFSRVSWALSTSIQTQVWRAMSARTLLKVCGLTLDAPGGR